MKISLKESPPLVAGPARSDWRTVLSLLPYLWPKGDHTSHIRVVVAGLCLVGAKLATVYVPYLYSQVIDQLSPKGRPVDILVVPIALIAGYGLLRVASSGFGELRDAVFAAVQQRAIRRAARRTFVHLHHLSLRFHLDRQTGGLSRAIDRGTSGIDQVLRLAAFNVLPTFLEVGMVTAVLWNLFDWRYALVTFLAVGLYIGFTLGFTSWRVKLRRQMNDIDSEAQTRAVDSLLNYETVKYFGNETHETERFDDSLGRYERAAVRAQVTLNMLNLGQALIIALGLSVIMLMAADEVRQGRMTIGRFVMANTYLMQLYTPLNFLGFVYRGIKQGLVDTEQMFRLLSVNREVTDRADAVALDSRHAVGVTFENVQFGYRPDHLILKGVSFSVPPGGKIAIVGPTGAGKSTIARLLFRFYDVTSGRILVDGHDVRDLQQDSLRAAIGVVPQDTVLFSDTIEYNIAYGRPGASQDDVEHAARLAQVHDFVRELPDGYATRVGERGLKLSGGEKQRVAIARTLLKDPGILILDEATSALDTRTEQEIQSALRTISRHRTTLTIAHRLSTVVESDQILVLDKGRVVEHGTHAALLAEGGLYAQMWSMQAEQETQDLEETAADAT